MLTPELEKLISELHKIQNQIELLQDDSELREKLVIIDPKVKGLCFVNGYYTDSTVNDPTTTPYFVGNYQLEYDRWYRSCLRRQDEKRLNDLKSQEYQIRKTLWEKTGFWKQFDKEHYFKE